MLKINIKQFGVDIHNFTKGERIGTGGYSEVFLAQYKKTGDNYAAKVASSNVFKEEEKNKIENEINIMNNTKHPTIIKYYGYSLLDFDSFTNIVIFMEYAKNGSLSQIIKKAKRSKLPPDYDNTSRQIILIGVSCGMKYLHHQNIMHRDLNTNNILLDENYYPHITDFGMAKYLHKPDLFKETPIIGTLPYMAPEMILGEKYTSKIDVYSFGILMYEVLCESDLYPSIANKETISTDNSITNEYREHIAVSKNRPEFTKEIKDSLKNLIQICWSSNPKERPNFDEIYKRLTNPEYYLENVDHNKIKKYIDFLTKSENSNSKDFELIEKVNSLSKDNDKLKDQIKSLKENNEKLSTKITQLQQMLDEKTKKFEKEPISIQPSNSKENEQLKGQIKSLTENNEKLSNKITQLQQMLDEKTKKIEKELNSIQPSNSKENEQLKGQIKSLTENNEKLSNKCNQLQRLLDEKTKRIEKEPVSIQPPNSKENDQLKGQIKSLTENNEKLSNKCTQLQQMLDEKTKKFEKELNSIQPSNSKENEQLKGQIKSLTENNEKLSNKCNQLQRMLDEQAKKFEKELISIQPPNSKENLMINSPRFRHRDKKEADSFLLKINNDKQQQQNSIKNDEKQLKQKFILNSERQLPSNMIIIKDENQLKQKLIKINDEKLLTTPQRTMKCDVKKDTPIIIVHEKSANDSDIVSIHQNEKKKPEETENPQKPPTILFTPIRDKINGQLIVPSTTPRRLPQFSNKDDEITARSLTPQKVKISDETKDKLPLLRKPNKTENFSEITINEFNSYTLQHQHQIINMRANVINSSSLFLQRKSNKYISNLQKFLNYIIQFVTSPDTSNFIEIQAENDDVKLEDITDSNQLNILSKTTEIIYNHQQLDSEEFYETTKLFKRISIEIQYFSKIYRIVYKIIFPINHLKINIFISGIKKTDNTFKGNKYIKSIRFDDSILSVSDYAFENCFALKSILFNSSITSIGSGSFEGCNSLMSVSIPSSVNSVGFSAFKGCSELTEISMSNSIKLIRNNTFYGCKSLKSFVVPSSVSSIGDYAFYQCSSLDSISIPSSVVSIGEFAFGECSTLKKISIPSSVESIGKSAFKGCTALEQISIPYSIHSLRKLEIIDDCKIIRI